MNYVSMPIASLLPGKSEGMAISDGMYAATIIGYAIKKTEYKNEDGTVRENVGASLIAQIRDDNGEIAHIATRPMAASLHEKAGLRKMLSGWLKKSDLQGILDSLINAGIIKDEVFSWDGFLGKTPLLSGCKKQHGQFTESEEYKIQTDNRSRQECKSEYAAVKAAGQFSMLCCCIK